MSVTVRMRRITACAITGVGCVSSTITASAPITVWRNAIGSTPITSFAVDRFSVEYLDRYLIGYSVADHEQYVFTADRPSARFRAPHVRALARTYGRDLGLRMAPKHPGWYLDEAGLPHAREPILTSADPAEVIRLRYRAFAELELAA